MWLWAAVSGAGAGLVGAGVMTAAEKLEQQWTGRPDSRVPGRTLARLGGLTDRPGRQLVALNWTMQFSQGTFMGSLRGVMAEAGLRGPWASLMFGSVRLTNDQILENATGVRAPPWTWPRRELAEDLGHMALYALVTGVIADALVARHGPGPKQSHARLVPGRREHVGPVARPH